METIFFLLKNFSLTKTYETNLTRKMFKLLKMEEVCKIHEGLAVK